ncbi:MAG: metal-dependent hydrolase [Candidatus Methanofastidiosum sp.]|nr:metal-dependent hydrolase [Methanofastidiosum sp.]
MKKRTHITLGILSAVIIIILLISIGIKPELPLGDIMIIGGIFGVMSDIDIFIRKHRSGLTHSVFTSVIVFLVISSLSIIKFGGILSNFITWDSAIVASSAVFSHTLADSLTFMGVPLYYPFSKRKHVHFPLIGGRVRYDDSFANTLIEISAISILAIIVISGFFFGLDSAPENSIKLIYDILNHF